MMPMIARDYARAGPARILETSRMMLHHHIEDVLPRVHVPTLVVRGTRDPIATRVWSEQVVRLLPDGRLLEIPGAAHATNFQAPAALARAVQPFVMEAPFVAAARP
jgi:2-hydroxy-6-oxonona-2,4-dienedioate hydrolase